MPPFVQVLSSAATIGLVVSVGYFAWRLFVLVKLRLLWRVRRKLILSYIFIGVVPSLLIVDLLPARRRAHLHERQRLPVQGRLRRRRRLREAGDECGRIGDVARAGESATQAIARTTATARAVSVLSRVCRSGPPPVRAETPPPGWRCCVQVVLGPWEHTAAPRPSLSGCAPRVPGGTIVVPSPDDPAQVELVIRAVAAGRRRRRDGRIRHHRSADRRRDGAAARGRDARARRCGVADRRRIGEAGRQPGQDRRRTERRHV